MHMINGATRVLDAGEFFGQLHNVHLSSHLRVTRSTHRASECIPSHIHAAPYLSLVLTGGYREHSRRSPLERESHSLCFHHAGEEHADSFGPSGAVCLNVELLGDWEETIAHTTLIEPSHPTRIGAPALLCLLKAQRADPLVLEEVVLDLVQTCAKSDRTWTAVQGSAPLRRATAFILERLSEPITLADVARATGIHQTHVCRLFRQRLDCTVSAYVRRHRLAKGQRLLLERREWSVSRIAQEAGFADHAHFTRAFRHLHGITPLAFRTGAT